MPKGHEIDDGYYLDIIIITSDLQEYLKAANINIKAANINIKAAKINVFINACASKDIGVMVLSVDSKPVYQVLNKSQRIYTTPPNSLSSKYSQIPNDAQIEDEIIHSIELIHGHFEIEYKFHNGSKANSHVPVLLSLHSFFALDTHLTYFQDLIGNELQSKRFSIFFFGIQENDGMEGFAHALVNNENERLMWPTDILKVTNKKVAIVCDVLCDLYDLDNFISSLKKNGAKDIFLIGLGKYDSFHLSSEYKAKSFLDIPCVEYKEDIDKCPACLHGSKVVEGFDIGSLLSNIREFDPYTFWELMDSSPNLFEVKHWPSGRTFKHYLHRIKVKEILHEHGYGIIRRVLNLLSEAKIDLSWLDVILCPDDLEAVIFSELICKTIGANVSIEIIKIPRKHFRLIERTKIPDTLTEYLFNQYEWKIKEEYEGNVSVEDGVKFFFQRRNVLIVDQAAHHFETLSALKYLCEYLDMKILAFTVLIDRIYPLDLGKILPNSHYIPLYRWPWPPYKDEKLCPCTNKYYEQLSKVEGGG